MTFFIALQICLPQALNVNSHLLHWMLACKVEFEILDLKSLSVRGKNNLSVWNTIVNPLNKNLNLNFEKVWKSKSLKSSWGFEFHRWVSSHIDGQSIKSIGYYAVDRMYSHWPLIMEFIWKYTHAGSNAWNSENSDISKGSSFEFFICTFSWKESIDLRINIHFHLTYY